MREAASWTPRRSRRIVAATSAMLLRLLTFSGAKGQLASLVQDSRRSPGVIMMMAIATFLPEML